MNHTTKFTFSLAGLATLAVLVCQPSNAAEVKKEKLQVFIMAGQSNMVGHAMKDTIPYMKTGPFIPSIDSLAEAVKKDVNQDLRDKKISIPEGKTREDLYQERAKEEQEWIKGLLEAEKEDVKRLSDLLLPDVTAEVMDAYYNKRGEIWADKALSRKERDAKLNALSDTILFTTGKRAYIAAFGECQGGARSGPAAPGFGATSGKIGPEYSFAMAMEQRLDAPILIVKYSRGGKTITYDFRPPSAPDFKTTKAYAQAKARAEEQAKQYERAVVSYPEEQKKYKAELAAYEEQMKTADEESRKKLRAPREPRKPSKPKVFAMDNPGVCWREMVEAVNQVLDDPGKYHPDYDADKGYEIAGFVWFQGYNDQFSDEFHGKYAVNMKLFIEDARKTFNTPDMPFVIGVLGTGRTKDQVDANPVSQAQRAAAALPEFKGTVAAVESYPYYTQEIYPFFACWKTPLWDSVRPQWSRSGSNKPYHYLGSGKFFVRLGDAFSSTMVELMDD